MTRVRMSACADRAPGMPIAIPAISAAAAARRVERRMRSGASNRTERGKSMRPGVTPVTIDRESYARRMSPTTWVACLAVALSSCGGGHTLNGRETLALRPGEGLFVLAPDTH